ncbi:hypothetical protein V501_08576 [Pseudogymnoascus sp. VKM F-4519 (FW-2642)]|nr:hypothetical protein V501_08576 [Pseudogymnoascus sp. VKM F-4519 (FW-2642)]
MPTTNVSSACELQLQEIADALSKSKKVVVITGAGISTNCGIPDFRSENGLYTLIQAQYDAAAANKTNPNTGDIDDRPVKRRKLDRSCSLGSSELENGIIKEAPLRRQLRSSQSFHTQATDSDSAGSNPDTPSEIPTKEMEETPKDISAEAVNEPIPSSQASRRSTASRQSLPNMKGKDLFDSIIWTDKLTTSIFYTFISSLRKKIYNDVTSTTATHKFIRALRDGGRLVRNYTQNIDMLEERETLCTELARGPGTRGRFNPKLRKEAQTENIAGGKQDSGVEVVHLHGSLKFLRCGLCAQQATWDVDRQVTTLAGDAPECPSCLANSAKREDKGRRSLAVGRLRPDIVLYGEEHPSADLVGPLITHDLSLGPDILLILGTSMRVHGLKVMVREFAKAVHVRGGSVVFVNQTKPPDSIWGDVIDYWVEWDCDAWVTDLRQRRGDIWLEQGMKPKNDKPTTTPKNPSAMRPDLTNGAYLQWNILSSLRQLTGRGEDEEAAKMIKRIDGLHKQAAPKSTVPRRRSLPATTKKQTSRIPLSNLSSNVQGLTLPANGKPKSTNGQRRALPSPPTSDEAVPVLPQPMTPRAVRIKKLTSIDAILSSPLSSPPKVIRWADY